MLCLSYGLSERSQGRCCVPEKIELHVDLPVRRGQDLSFVGVQVLPVCRSSSAAQLDIQTFILCIASNTCIAFAVSYQSYGEVKAGVNKQQCAPTSAFACVDFNNTSQHV